MSVKCTTCDKSCSFRKEPFNSDYAALETLHNALAEAVAWERECGTVSFTDLWFDEWSRTEDQSKSAMRELRFTRRAARADS